MIAARKRVPGALGVVAPLIVAALLLVVAVMIATLRSSRAGGPLLAASKTSATGVDGLLDDVRSVQQRSYAAVLQTLHAERCGSGLAPTLALTGAAIYATCSGEGTIRVVFRAGEMEHADRYR